MADNTEITKGSGTKVATDEISGVHVQRVKVQTGADGTAVDVSEAAPMPVSDAGGTLSVDDGGGAVSVDDNGSTLSVDDGGGSLTVDGTVAVSGTVPVSDGAGSLTVDAPLSTPVGVRLSDGSEAIGSTAKRLHVDDGGSSLTIDLPALGTEGEAEATGNGGVIGLLKRLRKLLEGTGVIKVSKVEEALPAGTNAIGKLAANSGVDIGDVDVTSLPELPAGTKAIGQTDPRGNKAHDEADAGNPIKVGAKGVTVLPAAVSTGDRTDALSDKFGRQLGTVAPLDQRVSGTTNFTNETAADVVAAPGASTALVITGIKVVNNHATVKTKVEILNDSTKIDLGAAAANGGGWVISDPNGLFPPLTTNKALRAKCLTTGADVDVTAYGYKIPA